MPKTSDYAHPELNLSTADPVAQEAVIEFIRFVFQIPDDEEITGFYRDQHGLVKITTDAGNTHWHKLSRVRA